ncbi:MAG: DNRLRE domain-containing protein [Verrucomicrobiota bacterium]
MKKLAIMLLLSATVATVDATTIIGYANRDNTVWQAAPDAVTSNGMQLIVRDADPSNDTYAFLDFDLSGLSGYSSSGITQAVFHVFVEWVNNGGEMVVSPVTNSWNETTLTWNNMPGVDGSLGTISGTTTGVWASIEVTGLVQDWIDGTLIQNGVRLHHFEDAYFHQVNITSSDSTNSTLPYLAIEVIEQIDPPEIISLSAAPGGDMVEMVVNAPSSADAYEPQASSGLVVTNWAHVEHSYTNDLATLALTNLSYATTDASGTNEVIYLQAAAASKFFKVVGFGASPPSISSVELGVVQDNTTWSAAPDTVSGTNDHLIVRDQAGSDVHTYIEFDLSGLAGYGSSNVVSAEMMFVVDYNNNGDQTAKISRVDDDWSTSTLTWNNAPGVTDVGINTTDFGSNGWKTNDVTDLVKSWVDGTANEGVRISYLPSAFTHQANIRSSEYAGTSYDPYIYVTVSEAD